MAVRINYHDAELMDAVSRATGKGLKLAAQHLQTSCIRATNASNQRGRVPSVPGEAPHKQTGQGQRGIVWESNDNEENPAVRVGVTRAAIYMYYLEIGTGPRTITASGWLRIPWTGAVIVSKVRLGAGVTAKARTVAAGETNKIKHAAGNYYYGQGKAGLVQLSKGQFDGLGNQFFIFRRSVRVPGIRPRPWLVPTLLREKETLGRLATSQEVK